MDVKKEKKEKKRKDLSLILPRSLPLLFTFELVFPSEIIQNPYIYYVGIYENLSE